MRLQNLVAGALLALTILCNGALAQPRQGADAAESMIAMIEARLETGQRQFGAGIIVGATEDMVYVATAKHVVQENAFFSRDVRVEFKARRADPVRASVAPTQFGNYDLAILVVRDERLASVLRRQIAWCNVVADHRALQWKKAYLIGFPKAEPWSTSPQPESITNSRTTELQVDSRYVYRGHSGGGVFDESWRLIGIMWADEPPTVKAYPVMLLIEEIVQRKFPVNLGCDLARQPRRPPVEDAPAKSISPALPSVPRSSLPNLTDISGSWSGTYRYDQTRRNDVPVNFNMKLDIVGDACRGWIEEPNTFGNKSAPRLFASVVCQLDISRQPARLLFKKTYDGTGGVSHPVDYSGDIAPDRRSVKGIWRIGNEFGEFTLGR